MDIGIVFVGSTAQVLGEAYDIFEVGSGFTASFLMDNWTDRGPLIDLIGDQGPSIMEIPIDVLVADAIIDGEWWLSRSRSRSPTQRML